MPTRTSSTTAPRIARVLTLRDLLVYGMIVMQVVAPMPVFGLLEQRSGNHAVLTVLIAMLPMLVTAVSYGRMAVLYPFAGSAYTYVSRALNTHLGFLIGWSMFLDYLMIPLISAIIPALAIQRVLPGVPLTLLTFLIVSLMTGLNLRGIRATMRANKWLLVLAIVAVSAFLELSVRFLIRDGGLHRLLAPEPLYSVTTFQEGAILHGISLAALTYIGFDGLTTLAEDSVNPKRDLVLSTFLVVAVTGILSGVELYFLHSVLPDWRMADPNTSYLDVMRIVGGSALFAVFISIMSMSQFGAGLSVQVSAARLLYGMGRDRILPQSLFGHLSSTNGNPSRNVLLVGALAFLGTVFIPFDDALDLVNFGAFLGYMGVNAATIWSFYIRPSTGYSRKFLWDLLLPASGFAGCLVFWIGLPLRAKGVGGLWLLAGLIYCAFKTRGFRTAPLLFNFSNLEKTSDHENCRY